MELVRTWEADSAAVEDAVRLARARGQLARVEQLPAPRGRAAVRVVLTDATRIPSGADGMRRPWTIVASVAGILAAAGGLAFAVVLLVGWIVAHAAELLGFAVLVALALAGLGGAFSSGGGRHCPGPWHR